MLLKYVQHITEYTAAVLSRLISLSGHLHAKVQDKLLSD